MGQWRRLLALSYACSALFLWQTLFSSSLGHAQSSAVTVLLIRQGLEDALNKFNSIVNAAGAEVRSSSASVASNAQNVITDLNSQLGGRLTDTVDQLKGAERQLIDDAAELTRRLQQATIAISTKTGQEARASIAEADIVAYNATYSLPCRTLSPRIVYAIPDAIRAGNASNEVRLRGNFLDIGSVPAVTVDNKPAQIVARSRNELVVALPTEIVATIEEPRSVSVLVRAQEDRRTNFWIYCWDRVVDTSGSSQAILIRPPLSFHISGTISGTYQTATPWSHEFSYSRSDGDCGASYQDNQQFCAPENFKLKAQDFSSINKISANCNSQIGDPQIAGERCVLVPAHLGGCGYDNLFLARNCRGRGFFEYRVTLRAESLVTSNIEAYNFTLSPKDDTQRSFQATHPDAAKNFLKASWHYSVVIDVFEGKKKIRTSSAGDGNPNPEGVTTRTSNGTVYINIQE
jgi:hypothetical protein